MKYSRIALLPLNPVEDYEYFVTCLQRSLHVITPTTLVRSRQKLEDVEQRGLFTSRTTTT